MSIYATWLALDGDGDHAESCAAYTDDGTGVWIRTEQPCDCPERLNAPLVYQGSNANPSSEDERAGYVMLCAIPDHCHPDVRDASAAALRQMREDGWEEIEPLGDSGMVAVRWSDRVNAVLGPIHQREAKPVNFLRLSVADGKTDVCVVLDRPLVEQIRDTLTAWLDAKERA